MRVGLTYNVKKDCSGEGDEHPPSTVGSDVYAEWDEPETIEAIRAALSRKHSVTLIEADEHAYDTLRTTPPDIVFNIAEGAFGASREAQMPAIFEMLRIPYTGSDPLTLALCLDKGRAKEVLAFNGVPTPSFKVFTYLNGNGNGLRYPMIVKPLFEGSSKGIFNDSVVNGTKELRSKVQWVLDTYKQPALVERYLTGREFTVALVGNGDNITVLPIVEIKFGSLPAGATPIYSFEAKWVWDRDDKPLDIFECPAQLDSTTRAKIEAICIKAYRVLRCRDWCRIDVRLDGEGNPYVIELNPLPGILPKPESNSCFPKAARAAGMDYDTLMNRVLEVACERYGIAP
ncbi:MAG: ATP-grasp domain-containing protein [Acidobacteria bacterium]|nr:ATP-grasp domain-containing protein [Acidobacteriota bacterium]